MTTIRANYGVMSAGHEGLVATWGRIESHLGRLDLDVAATADMDANVLTAFRLLKIRWAASAADRQVVLRGLADAVEAARTNYQRADQALAAQFEL